MCSWKRYRPSLASPGSARHHRQDRHGRRVGGGGPGLGLRTDASGTGAAGSAGHRPGPPRQPAEARCPDDAGLPAIAGIHPPFVLCSPIGVRGDITARRVRLSLPPPPPSPRLQCQRVPASVAAHLAPRRARIPLSPPHLISLDLDVGWLQIALEVSAYCGHLRSVYQHPLRLFTQHVGGVAMRRRQGNAQHAEVWDDLSRAGAVRQPRPGKAQRDSVFPGEGQLQHTGLLDRGRPRPGRTDPIVGALRAVRVEQIE